MVYYVYVLLQTNGHYYYGYTSNLERRINQHRNNEVKTTKNKFKALLYTKELRSKSEALKLEKYFKKLKDPKAVDHYFQQQKI